MKISEKLKERRLELKLSQKEVAEKLLVSRQTVSNWENDRSYPDLENLILLSQLYQFSLDELFISNRGEAIAMEKANLNQFAWSRILLSLVIIFLIFICFAMGLNLLKGEDHMKLLEYGNQIVLLITIIGFGYFIVLLEKNKIQITKKMRVVANIVFGSILVQGLFEFTLGLIQGFSGS